MFAGDYQKISIFQFMEIVAYKIPSMWMDFGMHVCIPFSVMKSIEHHRHFNDLECFADVYDYWQQMSTPHQPATWSSVVCILRDIDENELAHFIQETVM